MAASVMCAVSRAHSSSWPCSEHRCARLQVITLLQDMREEVATGVYIDSSGDPRVRLRAS